MDQVGLYNMALSSIGTAATVAATTEGSVEANELNIWYETVRDKILGSAFWDSVRATSRLTLAATRDETVGWTPGAPEPGWMYAYARPNDMLRPRFLSTYMMFVLALQNSQTPVIMTNDPGPLLVYTSRQVNINLWDQDLQFAVAYALGSVVALKLTGSKAKRDSAWQLAADLVMQARVDAANEQNFQPDFTPSALVARGYNDPNTARYIFPFAEVSASGFNNVS